MSKVIWSTSSPQVVKGTVPKEYTKWLIKYVKASLNE